MSTITIIRIEHEDGAGPFNTGAVSHAGSVCGMSLYDPPGPEDDSASLRAAWEALQEARTYRQYRFGFASEAQMDSWFPPDARKAMATRDYGDHGRPCLAVYEAPAEVVHVGERQAVFHRDRARLVSREPLSN